jgi:glutathione S-transferase
MSSSITIFGSYLSQPTRMVLQTAMALGIPFDFQRVDAGKGEHRTKEFLTKNPNARFPVLQEGDFIVYESNAIAQYLVNKHGKKYNAELAESLLPKDPAVLAHVQQYLDWKHGSLRSGCAGIVRRRAMRFMMKDITQHSMSLNFKEIPEEREARELLESLSVVEKQLAKTKAFLVEETSKPTLADLAIFEEIYQLRLLPPNEGPPFGSNLQIGYPNILQWFDRIKKSGLKGFDVVHKDLEGAVVAMEKLRQSKTSKM